jgi:ribosomal protein L37AE/L43A
MPVYIAIRAKALRRLRQMAIKKLGNICPRCGLKLSLERYEELVVWYCHKCGAEFVPPIKKGEIDREQPYSPKIEHDGYIDK